MKVYAAIVFYTTFLSSYSLQAMWSTVIGTSTEAMGLSKVTQKWETFSCLPKESEGSDEELKKLLNYKMLEREIKARVLTSVIKDLKEADKTIILIDWLEERARRTVLTEKRVESVIDTAAKKYSIKKEHLKEAAKKRNLLSSGEPENSNEAAKRIKGELLSEKKEARVAFIPYVGSSMSGASSIMEPLPE